VVNPPVVAMLLLLLLLLLFLLLVCMSARFMRRRNGADVNDFFLFGLVNFASVTDLKKCDQLLRPFVTCLNDSA
jgi:hypothetical protein